MGRSEPRRLALALLLGLTACQPFVPRSTYPLCITGALAPGEVYVGPVACANMQLPGGEGRGTDTWIGNSWYRGVIRSQDSAVSVPGLGGGTLIDAAPWGMADGLQEVIPIVGGGWLDVHDLFTTTTSVVVGGTVVPFPGRDAPDAGTERQVTWTVDPDTPWLRVDGAEGLWIHPSRGEVLDGQVVADDATWGHDGQVAEDLGGVLVVQDSTGLLVVPSELAPGWWDPDTVEITGAAPDASALEVLRGGEVVGRLPLYEASFDLLVQGDADGVRAVAPLHAPGPVVPPGTDLALAPGATGTIDLQVTWNGLTPRPARVDWQDDAGRSGTVVLAPRQHLLRLGAGGYLLDLSAGPAVRPFHAKVVVPPDGSADVEALLQARFDPGSRVLAALDWYGARSQTYLGTDLEALQEAAAAGLGFVVIAPDDDVASASSRPFPIPFLRWRNGARLNSPDGWSVTAWPWTATLRRAAHGAPPVAGLSPADALAAAWNGPGTDRFLLVDQAWLEAAGPPWTVRPVPDFVRLDAPGVAGPAAWSAWFTWLDAGISLVPVGPRAWVTVDDPTAFAGVDVEQGLTRGWTVATTGGLVDLRIAYATPGGVVPPQRPEGGQPIGPSSDPKDPRALLPVSLSVASAGTPLTHLALVVDGTVVQAWSVSDGTLQTTTAIPDDGHWAIAAAWSEDGRDFAVTSPVWLATPQRPGFQRALTP